MRSKSITRAGLCAALLSSAAFAMPAQAQTSDAASTSALDDAAGDILVSAQQANRTVVEQGGQVGVLGDQPGENVPFSVRSYTEALILNQQPDTLGEVLENDPTIRTTMGFGIAGEVFVIRGFPLFSDDVGFDGLYGIAPRQLVAPELLSSVQVINGASAFLNGAAPGGSGIGGSVNILPKMADRDLTRVTAGYVSDAHFSGAADVARRFGANDEWGVRINGSARRGDIAVNDEFHSSYVLGAGIDHDSGPLRASLSLNWQRLRQSHWRPLVTISTAIPDAPDADTNFGQPWAEIETEDFFGTASIEYDVADNATFYARVGARDGREDQYTSSFTLLDAATGAGSAGGSYVPREDNNEAATAGMRVSLAAGGISHQLNVGASASWQEIRTAYDFYAGGFATNLYDPVDIARPPSAFAGGNLDDPFPITRTRVSSVFASDTLGLWNDRILLTGGLRLQEIRARSYAYFGGELASDYRENAVTPVAGLVVKPADGISLYANRIEGLVRGDVAPNGVTDPATGGNLVVSNAGEVLAPYRSVQYEFGGKANFGLFNASLAFFQIDRPNSAYRTDTDNAGQVVFGPFGEQRNRGIEFTLDAEPVRGLRLIGGVAVNDPELRRTPGGLYQGNEPAGIPEWMGNANVEWDLPFMPALTLTGRAVYTGKQAADPANTLQLDDWARFDLGVRYVALVADSPLTLRFGVDNVSDEDYWASAFSTFGTQLLLGGPRTFKASASVEF